MASWIIQELLAFLTGHGAAINASVLTGEYFSVHLEDGNTMQLDFNPSDESLLFTLGIDCRADDTATLARLLHLNNIRQLGMFSPTGHLFESRIVLRKHLPREALQCSNFEQVLAGMLHYQRQLREV